MPTQLEDISNQVSQEKIGDNRLRNEEIRHDMYSPWTEKQEAPEYTTSAGTQPTSAVNPTGTLANIYSTLKNTTKNLGMLSDNATDRTDRASSYSEPGGYNEMGTSSGKMPSWMPGAAGAGLSILGLGKFAGLGSAAMNFSGGNTGAGLGNLAAWGIGRIPELGKIAGLPSLAGSLAADIYAGSSAKDVGNHFIDSAANTAMGKLIPHFGALNLGIQAGTSVYNAVTDNNYGFSALRGLRDLFGANSIRQSDPALGRSALEDEAQSLANNGFFKDFSQGNWSVPIASGNEFYSPYGGAPYETPRDAPVATMQGAPSATEAVYNTTPPPSTQTYQSSGSGYTPSNNPTYYGGINTSHDSYGGYSPTMNYSNTSGGYSGYSGGDD
jgi:hypothetical protein